MREYTNDCVGCPPGMGCMGESCRYVRVTHWFCDRCEKEVSRTELRVTEDGEELCEKCLGEPAMGLLPEPEE